MTRARIVASNVAATFRSPAKASEYANTSAWRRKHNRLEIENYRGPGVFSLTVAMWQRELTFQSAPVVHFCEELLAKAAAHEDFRLLAYCFMPDHLHLLLEGQQKTDLTKFVKQFKQLTSYHYRRLTKGGILWQKGYYDHVLRTHEDALETANYILNNPVRAGRVDQAKNYPFLGGSLLWEALMAT